MYLRNYLRQFLRDVRAQKLRLFLTVFGLVWGTAAVTLMLAFGEGLHRQVLVSQKGLGDAIVIAWPSRTSKPWQGLPRGRAIQLTDEDVVLLRNEVEGLRSISEEYAQDGARITYGKKALSVDVSGSNVEFGAMRSMNPQEGGRFLNQLDLDERRRVVFIGDQLSVDLFGKDVDPVGEQVRIDGSPFTVVGVMVAKSQDSSYGGRDKDKAMIPSTTFRAMYGSTYIENLIFQPQDVQKVEAVKKAVIATAANKHRFDPTDEEAIQMWDTTEGTKFLDTFFLAFRSFLGIVGALTLVVGGIGVSNIMNVVVEERTKEIGIKMALGAKRRYVIGQFLFETLLITIVGGIAGFLISWAVCAAFPSLGFQDFVGDPQISFQVAAITTAILGAIGLLAGYFPARTAANLRPVEALRM
ncbi:MAG: ABC transporter permease [Thermoanaerobaculia bacterium]|jgi:putative ABC transport system permease protein|nr:ABC transporter permease [Thermoanaerobaculia bacterium]MBP9823910.1 ABC transporter permease [Thermoanaerobaculia bacterium]